MYFTASQLTNVQRKIRIKFHFRMSSSQTEGEARLRRLKEVLVPQIVNNFRKGDDIPKITDIRIINSEDGVDHWASCTVFVHVDLEYSDKNRSTQKLVVKFPPLDKGFREFMTSDTMYKNECYIYQVVVPEYDKFIEKQAEKLGKNVLERAQNFVPKCYFAEFDPKSPQDSVIILEDLREHGYRAPKQRQNLDIEHIKQALVQLGRYHGIGYSFKLENKPKFDAIISKIYSPRYKEEKRAESAHVFRTGNQRALKHLLKADGAELSKEEIKIIFDIFQDSFSVMQYLTEPKESAVLCHGDFCSNNMFFRYNESGNPNDAILFDFQTPYYSSPAIDLSFFFYINTTKEFRDRHLDEMLAFYHSNVIATMTNILGRPISEPGFSLSEFKTDFANHALYGYSIAAFFLPVMMNIHKAPFNLEEHLKKPLEERIRDTETRGGDEATKCLVEIFNEFYERGFCKHLIEKFGKK